MADANKVRKETLRQIKIKTGVVKRYEILLGFPVCKMQFMSHYFENNILSALEFVV